jgi:hypothetical protein
MDELLEHKIQQRQLFYLNYLVSRSKDRIKLQMETPGTF